MPYSQKAHNFMALCCNTPGKAKGRCPDRATACKMMKEGVKKKRRK